MKITCPKNSKHKEFNVTAHVAESWIVDEAGNWKETCEGDGQVTHFPGKGDLFTCETCGEEAIVE